jgi:hypothetical protein
MSPYEGPEIMEIQLECNTIPDGEQEKAKFLNAAKTYERGCL